MIVEYIYFTFAFVFRKKIKLGNLFYFFAINLGEPFLMAKPLEVLENPPKGIEGLKEARGAKN